MQTHRTTCAPIFAYIIIRAVQTDETPMHTCMLRGACLQTSLCAAWHPQGRAAEIASHFYAHWRCRRRTFSQGGIQEWSFTWGCEVGEWWHHQVCVLKAAADMKSGLKWLNRLIEEPQVFFGWSRVCVCPFITLSVRSDAPSVPYASDGANISPFQHLSGGNEWAWRERWWRRRRKRWRRRRPGGPVQEQKERKHPCEFGWEWTFCWKSKRRGIASVFLSLY